ncbi:hypothetical protein EGW08_006880, partial [Elysia chlorotica]
NAFSLAGFVCQRDLSTECRGVFSSGRCLSLYHNINDWNAAKAACQQKGSYLAEPKTEILARTVNRFVTNTTGVGSAFLGGHDLETEGVFVWDYSQELFSDGFTDWATNQPDNSKDVEDYVEFSVRFNGWNDLGIYYTNRSFICEQVIPAYHHSYVTVVPREKWRTDFWRYTLGMLSLASFPSQRGHNYVEISTFPAGDLQTTSLFQNEAYQYYINNYGLFLDTNGVQEKYVRVRSTDPLDVHYFLWARLHRFACSSLVLEDLAPGMSSAFFSQPANTESSLGEIFAGGF